jgi:hypothetical protein
MLRKVETRFLMWLTFLDAHELPMFDAALLPGFT